MKPRLLLVAAAALLAVSVALALWPSAQQGRFSGVLSTRRADALGAKALYEVLRAGGLDPARRSTDLEMLTRRGVLFLLAPEPPPAPMAGLPKRPTFGKAERREVRRWVEKSGGNVVVVASRTTGLHRDFGMRIVDEDVPVIPRGRRRKPSGLERTIDKLMDRMGRRKPRRPPPVQSLKRRGPVLPTGGSPLGGGARRLEAPRIYHLDVPATDSRTLFAHDGRAVVAAVGRGRGMAVFVSTPFLASNVGLGDADNLLFFHGLATILSVGGVLQFDEYHHGERQPRGLVALLAAYRLHFAVLQAILALFLAAWAARRMIRRRGRGREAPRGAPERLAAMASLYERGGMARFAADRLWQATLAAIASRLRVRGERTATRLARALDARGRGEVAGRLRDLAGREAALGASIRPRELVSFARELSELRQEIAPQRTKETAG